MADMAAKRARFAAMALRLPGATAALTEARNESVAAATDDSGGCAPNRASLPESEGGSPVSRGRQRQRSRVSLDPTASVSIGATSEVWEDSSPPPAPGGRYRGSMWQDGPEDADIDPQEPNADGGRQRAKARMSLESSYVVEASEVCEDGSPPAPGGRYRGSVWHDGAADGDMDCQEDRDDGLVRQESFCAHDGCPSSTRVPFEGSVDASPPHRRRGRLFDGRVSFEEGVGGSPPPLAIGRRRTQTAVPKGRMSVDSEQDSELAYRRMESQASNVSEWWSNDAGDAALDGSEGGENDTATARARYRASVWHDGCADGDMESQDGSPPPAPGGRPRNGRVSFEVAGDRDSPPPPMGGRRRTQTAVPKGRMSVDSELGMDSLPGRMESQTSNVSEVFDTGAADLSGSSRYRASVWHDGCADADMEHADGSPPLAPGGRRRTQTAVPKGRMSVASEPDMDSSLLAGTETRDDGSQMNRLLGENAVEADDPWEKMAALAMECKPSDPFAKIKSSQQGAAGRLMRPPPLSLCGGSSNSATAPTVGLDLELMGKFVDGDSKKENVEEFSCMTTPASISMTTPAVRAELQEFSSMTTPASISMTTPAWDAQHDDTEEANFVEPDDPWEKMAAMAMECKPPDPFAKLKAEQVAADQIARERAAAAAQEIETERVAAEKIALGKIASEKVAAEKVLADEKAAAEQALQEQRATADKIAQDCAIAEKAEAARIAEQVALETAEAERAAAKEMAEEQVAAEKAAVAEKAVAEQAAKELAEVEAQKIEAERIAAEDAALEKAASDKAAAEKAIAEEQAAAENVLQEQKATADKIAEERAIAERAEAERIVAEKIVCEKAVAEQFLIEEDAERRAVVAKSVAEQRTRERAAVEAQQVEIDRIVAETAALEKAATQKQIAEQIVAEDRAAAEQVLQEQNAAEKVAEEFAIAERAEAKRVAAEKVAWEHIAAENSAQERVASEKAAEKQMVAEKAAAEQAAKELIAKEKIAKALVQRRLKKAAAERIAKEKVAAEKVAVQKTEAAATEPSAKITDEVRVPVKSAVAQQLAAARAKWGDDTLGSATCEPASAPVDAKQVVPKSCANPPYIAAKMPSLLQAPLAIETPPILMPLWPPQASSCALHSVVEEMASHIETLDAASMVKAVQSGATEVVPSATDLSFRQASLRPDDLASTSQFNATRPAIMSATMGATSVVSNMRDLEAELWRLNQESATIASRGRAMPSSPPRGASPPRGSQSASIPQRYTLSNEELEAQLLMLSCEGEHVRAKQRYSNTRWLESERARKLVEHYSIEGELKKHQQDGAVMKWLDEMDKKELADLQLRSNLRRNAYYEDKLQVAKYQGAVQRAWGEAQARQDLVNHESRRHGWWRNEFGGLREGGVIRENDILTHGEMLSDFGVRSKSFAPDEYGWYLEGQRERLNDQKLEDDMDYRLGIGAYSPQRTNLVSSSRDSHYVLPTNARSFANYL